ncbi:triose-phosphate isomerase [Litorihabitans aurantiacus]|uniref:Triosephosphate isomerase n=1 Tax=Litorihabitans aurantiacus TaxID=1930061 RepID=A0AA37UHW8_9MICO|nr:triose-phosphate isomerase [Litorihabitans aurantiacus]GMA31173.1 triosephosphate isomerase [Litorihabitans aurantiacus]
MVGNWKLNLDHHQAIQLVQKLAWTLGDAKHDYDAVEVVVSPSFTSLRSVQTLVDGDKLGLKYASQDISAQEKGAYTGEVSAAQLSALGVSYAIVGHSERREYHAESDALVNAKIRAALGAGITPIVCVGEPLEVRQASEHVAHTLAQVDGALADLTPEQVASLVVAYEPVWAIGTGEVATPEDAQEIAEAIRARVAETVDADVAAGLRILYGGSVKADNVAQIMAKPDVDGALVGGASLVLEQFAAIAGFQRL